MRSIWTCLKISCLVKGERKYKETSDNTLSHNPGFQQPFNTFPNKPWVLCVCSTSL